MKQVVTISNLKGGCGKTSICILLASAFEEKGKTILIDLDAQSNLTAHYMQSADYSAIEVLSGRADINRAVKKINEKLYILPGSADSTLADRQLNTIGKELKLKEQLKQVAADFDYCIIDTAPALNILTINAYTASDSVLIPIKSGDIFSLQAIDKVNDTIKEVKKYYNSQLQILGIVINEYKQRGSYDLAIEEQAQKLCRDLNLYLFENHINKTAIIEQNKSIKQNLLKRCSNKKVKDNLNDVINEVMKIINVNNVNNNQRGGR